MALVRPRLTEFYGLDVAQVDVDFAIPFLNEDLPLYVDPFLLWKSPSLQDQALHGAMITAFNHLGWLARQGKSDAAAATLVRLSECDEVGLGGSGRRVGKRFSQSVAFEILSLLDLIQRYSRHGFNHFEEIQLFIDGVSKDRITDIACNFLKSFLIDFTIEQCDKIGVPR